MPVCLQMNVTIETKIKTIKAFRNIEPLYNIMSNYKRLIISLKCAYVLLGKQFISEGSY